MSTVTPRKAETFEANSSIRELFCLEVTVRIRALRTGRSGLTSRVHMTLTWYPSVQSVEAMMNSIEGLTRHEGFCRAKERRLVCRLKTDEVTFCRQVRLPDQVKVLEL